MGAGAAECRKTITHPRPRERIPITIHSRGGVTEMMVEANETTLISTMLKAGTTMHLGRDAKAAAARAGSIQAATVTGRLGYTMNMSKKRAVTVVEYIFGDGKWDDLYSIIKHIKKLRFDTPQVTKHS